MPLQHRAEPLGLITAVTQNAGVRISRRILGESGPSALAIVALTLTVRLAVLSTAPIPYPTVHDEFGHLLVADTLRHGRLANPPHALASHFESIYVLQHPRYASIYPLGQGAALALGTVFFGHPWYGVLISAGLMAGAITWMLLGGLPAPWARLGGLFASLHYGLSPWIDSYWGGYVSGIGGALVCGAVLRLHQRGTSAGLTTVVALGWALVWFTRPFEAVLVGVIGFGVAAILTLRGKSIRDGLRIWTPAALILTAALSLSIAHNKAVTGSFSTLPYQISRSQYGVPQSFIWVPPVTQPAGLTKEAQLMYQWQREQRDAFGDTKTVDATKAARYTYYNFLYAYRFYVPSVLLGLLILPVCSVFRNPRKTLHVLLPAGIVIAAILWSSAYPFFYPHYIAAYAGLIVYLLMTAGLETSQWQLRSVPIGRIVATVIIVVALVEEVATIMSRQTSAESPVRSLVEDRLRKTPGRDLVLVSYLSGHDVHDEWVYNAADIDASDIVWMRAVPSSEWNAIRRYYPGRTAWTVQVDRDSAIFSKYADDESLE
jgi:hypothetical protein